MLRGQPRMTEMILHLAKLSFRGGQKDLQTCLLQRDTALPSLSWGFAPRNSAFTTTCPPPSSIYLGKAKPTCQGGAAQPPLRALRLLSAPNARIASAFQGYSVLATAAPIHAESCCQHREVFISSPGLGLARQQRRGRLRTAALRTATRPASPDAVTGTGREARAVSVSPQGWTFWLPSSCQRARKAPLASAFRHSHLARKVLEKNGIKTGLSARVPHGTKMKLPKQEPPKVGSWQGGCWSHLSQSRRLLCFWMANTTFQWASAGCVPWLIPTEGYGEGRTPPSLRLLHLPSLQKDPHYTSVCVELPARSWPQREPPDGEMRPCHQQVRPAPGLSNAPVSSCRRLKKLTHAKPGFKGP